MEQPAGSPSSGGCSSHHELTAALEEGVSMQTAPDEILNIRLTPSDVFIYFLDPTLEKINEIGKKNTDIHIVHDENHSFPALDLHWKKVIC